MKSYILINTKPSEGHNVYDTLLKNKKITDVNHLFGEYDMIVTIDTDNFDSLGDIIINEIRTIKGITNMKTLTGVKF